MISWIIILAIARKTLYSYEVYISVNFLVQTGGRDGLFTYSWEWQDAI